MGAPDALIPPRIRTIVVPPADHPREARGRTYILAIFVDAAGKVVDDSTRFTPAIQDRGFARRFHATIARYSFTPAESGGCPVAAWTQQTVRYDD